MDLNFNRRKRERVIAKEVADAFLQATDATELAPPEKLTHHFTLVCERLAVAPDEAAVSRILAYTLKEVIKRERVLDNLMMAVNRLPDETTLHSTGS